jgi:hypothetical protein
LFCSEPPITKLESAVRIIIKVRVSAFDLTATEDHDINVVTRPDIWIETKGSLEIAIAKGCWGGVIIEGVCSGGEVEGAEIAMARGEIFVRL